MLFRSLPLNSIKVDSIWVIPADAENSPDERIKGGKYVRKNEREYDSQA